MGPRGAQPMADVQDVENSTILVSMQMPEQAGAKG